VGLSSDSGVRSTATVILVDLPARLWDEARQYRSGLCREFSFLVASEADGSKLGKRLLEIAETSDTHYAETYVDAESAIEEALARGDAFCTVTVEVPRDIRRHIIEAIPILMEVDRYCRDGAMLMRSTTPELRRFSSWSLGEFVRQLEGEPPRSWRVSTTT
jgi:hypothetical protein